MSGLSIDSADRLRTLQNLAEIAPPEEVKKPEPPSGLDPKFKSNAEKTQAFYESFWEGLLTLFIKIPLIKNLTLTIWRFGLWSLQPSNPIKNPQSLLFNSTIEIPKWFNDDMRRQASVTLRRHFLTELKMVVKQAPADLNTIVRLSQLKVSRELYTYPAIIQGLEKGLKEATYSVIQRIQAEHPGEPLQIHLGGNSYENPLERLPLSGLFIQAFTDCLEEHNIPIRILHIHGPCDNNSALKILLEKLNRCHSLYHLHLDLDEQGSKKAFESLSNALKSAPGLQNLVFRNYARDHKFWVLDEHWLDLVDAIHSHRNIELLAFYDLPQPPEVFRKALQGFKICPPHHPSQQGFCIKKL